MTKEPNGDNTPNNNTQVSYVSNKIIFLLQTLGVLIWLYLTAVSFNYLELECNGVYLCNDALLLLILTALPWRRIITYNVNIFWLAWGFYVLSLARYLIVYISMSILMKLAGYSSCFNNARLECAYIYLGLLVIIAQPLWMFCLGLKSYRSSK